MEMRTRRMWTMTHRLVRREVGVHLEDDGGDDWDNEAGILSSNIGGGKCSGAWLRPCFVRVSICGCGERKRGRVAVVVVASGYACRRDVVNIVM